MQVGTQRWDTPTRSLVDGPDPATLSTGGLTEGDESGKTEIVCSKTPTSITTSKRRRPPPIRLGPTASPGVAPRRNTSGLGDDADHDQTAIDMTPLGDWGRSESEIAARRSARHMDLEDSLNPNREPAEPSTAILLSPKKKVKRAIFVDWARSIAVYVVVIVHIFVSVQRVTTAPPIMQEKIDGSIRLVLQFGMPMFFYFSGRSSGFAKGTMISYLKGKVLRLIVPLIVGMCIFVIPTNYVGREYRNCNDKNESNFFKYWVMYWKNFGCNGFDWYWFLPVLFILSVLNQYFLFWVKHVHEDKARKLSLFTFDRQTDVGPLAYLAVLLAVVLGTAAGIQAPLHIFFLAFLPHILLAAVTLSQGLVQKYNLIYVLYLCVPVSSLILSATVADGYPADTTFASFSGVAIMVVFYQFYYIQGYVDNVYDDQWSEWRDTAAVHAGLKPIGLLCMIVFIAIGTPTTSTLAGYLYTYPMYKADPYLCFLYIGGSWIWLMLWIRYAQTFYNEVLNKFEYTHITASSMIVYLTHWFFIDCMSVLIIKPAEMGIVGGIAVLIPGVAICCGLLYAGIVALERLAKRISTRGKRRENGDGSSSQPPKPPTEGASNSDAEGTRMKKTSPLSGDP